jgi:bacteriorhodopsin
MNYPCIFIAAGGSLAINLLNFVEALNLPKDTRPNFSEFTYWVPFMVFPILGGFVSYVYMASDYDIKPVLALQLGASAPLILRAAASAIPPRQPPKQPPGA